MNLVIKTVADLGLAVRAVRRSSGVRLDDLAGTAGLSKQFVSDVEHGKETVQLGLVLKALAELGIPLALTIPDEAKDELLALTRKGVPPPAKRQKPSSEARALNPGRTGGTSNDGPAGE
jgi:transcriptional regulator with XRE-family HTH domain